MDGFPSGQRGQTVNLLAVLSVVRIHLHPFAKHFDAERCAVVAELADAQDLKSCGLISRAGSIPAYGILILTAGLGSSVGRAED